MGTKQNLRGVQLAYLPFLQYATLRGTLSCPTISNLPHLHPTPQFHRLPQCSLLLPAVLVPQAKCCIDLEPNMWTGGDSEQAKTAMGSSQPSAINHPDTIHSGRAAKKSPPSLLTPLALCHTSIAYDSPTRMQPISHICQHKQVVCQETGGLMHGWLSRPGLVGRVICRPAFHPLPRYHVSSTASGSPLLSWWTMQPTLLLKRRDRLPF